MSNRFEDNNRHLSAGSYRDNQTRGVRAQENWWGSTDPAEIEAMISPFPGESWVPHVNFTRVAASCGGELLSGYVRGYIRTYERWRDLSVPYHLVEEATVGDDALLDVDPGVQVLVTPTIRTPPRERWLRRRTGGEQWIRWRSQPWSTIKQTT